MIQNDPSPVIGRVMRFGVPLVILIFYVSASTGMTYTPDATFRSVSCATSIAAGGDCGSDAGGDGGSVPNPAWTMLLGAAAAMGLSSLLAAKVLSLFFASLGILAMYLLALEITDDRLLAFGATLVFAVDAWMLQAAPGGSAAAATVAIMLATLFFQLRGEYLLAAIFSGICTLLFWQAAPLLLSVLIDLFLVGRERGHALRLAGGAVGAFTLVLLLWLAYAAMHGLPAWPGEQNTDSYRTDGWRIGSLVLMGLFIGGGIIAALAGKERTRSLTLLHLPVWLWMAWLAVALLVWDRSLLFFLSPLLVLYAFFGLRTVAEATGRSASIYPAALALTAVLMLSSQILYTGVVKPVMDEEARQLEEIRSLGNWMQNNLPVDIVVASEKPGTVAYFSGKQVRLFDHGPLSGDEPAYLVTSRDSVAGYLMLASPGDEVEQSLPGSHFTLWRKQ